MITKERVDKVINIIRIKLDKDDMTTLSLNNVNKDNVVEINLKGDSEVCPIALQAKKLDIEATLKYHLPEIRKIIYSNEAMITEIACSSQCLNTSGSCTKEKREESEDPPCGEKCKSSQPGVCLHTATKCS